MNLQSQNQMIARYHKPGLFYLLAIAIPWALWLTAGYISHQEPYTNLVEWSIAILSLAGLIAPLVIALAFIWPDLQLRQDFILRIFNFKEVKGQYLLITFFLMLVSILSAQAISLFFGYSADQFQLRGGYTFNSALFPVWFLLIAAPVLEELAWHSYGTDCLRSRFNLFMTSLAFAIFWGFWHFPLSFIKDYYHSHLVESGLIYSLNFIVSLIPFVLIMNWLYYKTNRNILLPIVFHITAGFFNEIFLTHPMSKVIQTVLLLILSLYLVYNDRTLFFGKLQ